MAVRLPGQIVLSVNATDTGTASVAGGTPYPFQVPQDTDNIVVKFNASIVGAAASATLQTSDDGGTTYYDIARTSTISGGVPEFLSAATISAGVNPIVRSNATAGSVLGGAIGSAGASTLGSRQVSGLPILGIQNRLFVIYTGNITTSSVLATVRVNQQSATA